MSPSNQSIKHNETKDDEKSAYRTPVPNYKSNSHPPHHPASLSTSTEDHDSTTPTPSYAPPTTTNSSYSDYPLPTPVTNKPPPSPSPSPKPTTNPTPHTPTLNRKGSKEYKTSLTGVKIIDKGEKDNEGQVLQAGHERCDECGRRVVWATKGEYLMICEGCGEPQ